MLPVEITTNDATLQLTASEPASLNPAVLCTQGYTTEEIHNIRQDLESLPPDQVCAQLAALLKLPLIPPDDQTHSGPRLCTGALLAYADKTGMTASLIRELHQLQHKPFDDLAHTALYPLLTDDAPQTTITTPPDLLEVFLMNDAQEHAVANALQSPLTLITGPPGTGKSQVVLNIIANAVTHHQTVLFASKNNKAVDVVVDKLNAILPRPLAIRMGHRAIRQQTAAACHTLLTDLPAPPATPTDHQEYARLSIRLTHIRRQLHDIAHLNHQLDTTLTALDTHAARLPPALYQTLTKTPAYHDPDLDRDLHRYFPATPHHHLPWTRRRQHACYHRHLTHLPTPLHDTLMTIHDDTPNHMATTLRTLTDLHHLQEHKTTQQTLTKTLRTTPTVPHLLTDTHTLQHHRQTLARTLLTDHWLRTLHHDPTTQRHLTTYLDLTADPDPTNPNELATRTRQRTHAFRHTLPNLPIWVVTNLSAHRSLPLENNLFDLLIIDEASQCDIPSALPLLYRAKHAVIIGDPNQLRHVSLLTTTDDHLTADHHHAAHHLDRYAYTTHSLYDLIADILTTNHRHPILLNEHYRCHPDIITYSNLHYYHGNLTIMTHHQSTPTLPDTPTHLTWHHTTGHTTTTASPYNEQEAQACIDFLTTLYTHFQHQTKPPSLGVVTLFRAHADLIADKIAQTPHLQDLHITVGTAHRFQGDERDIIILSPAISTGVKPGTLYWIWTTRQLINVAVSRARTHLIIIGDKTTCAKTPGPLADLAHYADALTHTTTPQNPHTQRLLRQLETSGLPFSQPPPGTTPIPLDLTLTINSRRYAIILTAIPISQDYHRDNNELRKHGWIPRRYQLTTDEDNDAILTDLLRLY